LSQPNPELTIKEHEDFFSKGYFVRKRLFAPSEVQKALSLFDDLQKKARQFRTTTMHKNSQFVVDQDRIDRIVWACGSAPKLKPLSRDPRLTLPSALLLQSVELQQLICQAHFKLPGDQVAFPWHQDSQHRGYGTDRWTDINQKGSFVQTLVALDPCPLESGPVYFIDNTVAQGHLALDQSENMEKHVDSGLAVPLLMEPGDTVFFHPFVIHGSMPNLSSKPRRVFINGFAYPGANMGTYPGCGLGESFRVSLHREVAA